MKNGTVCLVTRNGLWKAPEDLPRILAVNFFGVFSDSGYSPETTLFYTDGVQLACEGSAIVESLRALEKRGTRMFFPGQSLYLGSKGAVDQFVRALSWELGARGITVNAISPGPAETDMMQDRYRDNAAGMSPFSSPPTQRGG